MLVGVSRAFKLRMQIYSGRTLKHNFEVSVLCFASNGTLGHLLPIQLYPGYIFCDYYRMVRKLCHFDNLSRQVNFKNQDHILLRHRD